MKKIIIAVMLFALMASCNNQEKKNNNNQKTTTMENQEKAAIEKTLNTYFGSLNASDVKTAVGSYTTDGVFMPTKFPTATGTDQLVAAYGNVFKAIQLNVTVTIEEVIIRDDIAFARTYTCNRRNNTRRKQGVLLFKKRQRRMENCPLYV
jgi:ketosteroid isomerase-like protein